MNTEIAKLKAINKVNIEIWNRLDSYGDLQSQQVKSYMDEQQFFGPLINSPKRANRQHLQFNTISSVTFQSNQLYFYRSTETISIESMSVHFPKEINFFNDALPDTAYFDLSYVIDKYDYLDKSKSVSLLSSWKKALEDVQTYLGNLERKALDLLSLTQQVEEIFFPKQNQSKVGPKVEKKNIRDDRSQFRQKGNRNVSLTFSFPCATSNLDDLKMAAKLLYNNYTLERNGLY